MASIVIGACGVAAQAATPAGSTITNVATARLQLDTTATGATSNPATLKVAELLDLTLEGPSSATPTVGAVSATPFVLRNTGNGTELFTLHGAITGAASIFLGFAQDSNGNGLYDPQLDTPIANDGTTAALAPGQSITFFALLRTDSLGSGTLSVTATAATGSGTAGTVFAGKGDGGSDAIVGKTTARATLALPVSTTATGATPDATLVKSATVLAPDGTDTAVSGAIVTYSIVASFPGPEAATNAAITDPVPDGTTYVPASLRLDGAPLSDAADGDAGTLSATGIAFALGNVAAPATHTVSFKVQIK